MPELKPLVGDVTSQFTFGKPEDFQDSIEAVRIEQEAMCGYPLVVKGTRQTQSKNAAGHDVFEVFVTFMPHPQPPAEPLPVPEIVTEPLKLGDPPLRDLTQVHP